MYCLMTLRAPLQLFYLLSLPLPSLFLPHLSRVLPTVIAAAPQAALAYFRKAAEKAPLHPLPYMNAARTYQQLGQTSVAMRHLDR